MATLFGNTAEKKQSSTSLFGGSTLFGGYNTDKVNHSIQNAETRIQDAGYKPQNSDSRNGLEKVLNLPEHQNVIFDILDVLGRPLHGIENVFDKSVFKGSESPLTALGRGVSGKEHITGAELANTAGINNPAGKFLLGTALDIGLDPTTYIPGGVIAKGVKGAAKGVAAPVKAGYKALESVSPALKNFREGTVQPLFGRAKDAAGYGLVPDYKLGEDLSGKSDETLLNAKQAAENKIAYQTEESLKNVADAAKLAGGVEKGNQVGRVMEKDLKQFETLPLTKEQEKQIKDIEDEINSVLPESKQLSQEIKDLVHYHYGQVALETQSPLLNKIKELTGGKMVKTSDMEEIKNLPVWMKRKDGKPIDELADELGYKYADDLMQDIKKAVEKKPKVKDLRNIVKQRLAEDEYYQGLLHNQQGFKQVLSTLNESKQGIQPEVRQISRPVREISSDPAIHQAAQKLVDSNTELRQLAADNDIAIPELEGYMKHVLAKEERKRRNNVSAVDRGNRGTGQPNKSILNQRKLTGSAEDVNDRLDRTFFEPNAFFATAIGQKQLIQYIHAVNFRRQVLTNSKFARKLKEGETPELHNNQTIIDTNNYKFIKEGEDVTDKGIEEIGGRYLTTKAVKHALDRYQKLTTDEGINGFLKIFDTAQSTWKRLALFSVPYHLRNDIGAKFNAWVGGMSAPSIAKYSALADKEVYNAVIKGKETPLYNEFRQQGLSNSGLTGIEFARRGEQPEEAIKRTIEKRSQFDGTLKGRLKAEAKSLKNPLNAFQTSQEFGQFVDTTNRFMVYKWARDKGMTPEKAAKKVNEIMFDYTRQTPLEREVISRVIPFYRWMRNNLPFQVKQFIHDPRKYEAINKIRENAQSAVGIDEENVPNWMKESFAIPVSGKGGSGKFLGLNLPVGDLTKLSHPLKTLIDAVTPLAKLPAEVALNRNFFYNKPIKEFQGQQKQFQFPGSDKKFGIDQTLAYILEQMTGQIGRGLSGYLTKPEQDNQDTKFRTPSLGISSVLKNFDADKAKYFELLDKLRQLQDYINYIEQQTGKRPRTMQEINASTNGQQAK